MTEAISIRKIREQVHLFEQVLAMTYKVPLKISVSEIGNVMTPEQKIEVIKRVVCDYFAVPITFLDLSTRKRKVVMARQVAMTMIAIIYRIKSKKATGVLFNRDRTTVIASRTAVTNLVQTDKAYAFRYNEILKVLESKIGTP